MYGLAPWHGRLWLGSDKMAEQSLPPGMVLPAMVHGGPGRAGHGVINRQDFKVQN